MKKIFLAILAIGVSCVIMADDPEISAQMTMAVSSANGAFDEVFLFESNTFSADVDEDYDAKKMMNDQSLPKAVNFYAKCTWEIGKATILGESSLEGVKLEFISNKVTDDVYTITFSNVSGTPYYLKDSKVQDAAGNDSLTAIVAGGTYSFTQAVSTTEERFEIVKKPAEPTICHQYGNLIITGHKGAKVKVLDMADQVAITEQTLATDDEVISLSELTSGEMYQVVVDDGEPMLIRIQ